MISYYSNNLLGWFADSDSRLLFPSVTLVVGSSQQQPPPPASVATTDVLLSDSQIAIGSSDQSQTLVLCMLYALCGVYITVHYTVQYNTSTVELQYDHCPYASHWVGATTPRLYFSIVQCKCTWTWPLLKLFTLLVFLVFTIRNNFCVITFEGH